MSTCYAAGFHFASAWLAEQYGYNEFAQYQLRAACYLVEKYCGDCSLDDIFVEVVKGGFFTNEELDMIKRFAAAATNGG